MNKLNLQPLTKILKQEYSMNEESRTQCSVPLNYINTHIQELNKSIPNTNEIDNEAKNLQIRFNEVKGRINRANTEYTKLNSALSRLQKNFDEMDLLVKETEKVWETLHNIEERLPPETPKYT